MTIDKTTEEINDVPKRSPLLLILAVAVVLLLAAGAFYLQLQKTAITEEQGRLKEEIKSLNSEITALESQKLEAAQLAQQWLASIQQDEIRWSNILDKIDELVPQDILGARKVDFLSYSGSQGGKLVLNAQTKPSKIEPFKDVADLISSFNSTPYFFDAYVPTISRGETETGDKLLTFIFNVSYREKLPEDITTSTSTIPPVSSGTTDANAAADSGKVKVTR
jgi:Tfp pilus assembly protein PilN